MKKAVHQNGSFFNTAKIELLDLCFFVRHVLAYFGIEFHDLHFRRRGALVFGRRVEMTRTGGRFQLDFVAA